MGCDQHGLAAQHAGQDLGHVVGPDAGAGVLEALAAGRRHVVGAAPDVDLLLAPFLAGVVLVEAGEIAIVTLVERLVADHLEIGLADALEDDQVQRVLGADQVGGEGNIELEAGGLQRLGAGLGFLDAELGQVRDPSSR
jgi:hypothetical protein